MKRCFFCKQLIWPWQKSLDMLNADKRYIHIKWCFYNMRVVESVTKLDKIIKIADGIEMKIVNRTKESKARNR